MRDQTPTRYDIIAERGGPLKWLPNRGGVWVRYEAFTTLTARCEALEQEKNARTEECRDWTRRYVSMSDEMMRVTVERDDLRELFRQQLTRREAADIRCQHLEQAVKEAQRREESLRLIIKNLDAMLKTEAAETDENRVSFAAGYTAALDDALKGTK